MVPTPERTFLALASGFGLLFALVTPPYHAPDEDQHLARAYLISRGRLSMPGRARGHRARIPASLVDLRPSPRQPEHAPGAPGRYDAASVLALLSKPLAAAERTPLRSRSYYSPVVYAPQALAVAIARRAEPAPVVLLYVARLANLAAWVGIAWLALRTLPVRGWSVALVALTPMSVFSGSTVTADSGTSAIAWLMIALLLRVGFGPGEAVTRRGLAAVVATSALLGLAKPGYAPLAAAILLVPARRFGSARRRRRAILAVAAAVVLPTAFWTWAVRSAEPAAVAPDVDFGRQLAWILGDPLGFLDRVAASFDRYGLRYAMSWVGALGLLEVALPTPLYFLYPAAVVATALAEGPNPPELGAARRLGMVGLFLLCGLCVMLLAYVGWTPVGHPRVEGVQGRYFSPMAPLLVLALPSLRRPTLLRPWWIVGFTASVLAVSFVALVRHYYVA